MFKVKFRSIWVKILLFIIVGLIFSEPRNVVSRILVLLICIDIGSYRKFSLVATLATLGNFRYDRNSKMAANNSHSFVSF